MPITGAIDLRNLLKLEKYAGEKEKFQDFKWQLYVAVRVLNDGLLARLEYVEQHLEEDYAMSRLDPADQAWTSEAYTLLALPVPNTHRTLPTTDTVEHPAVAV